MHRLRSTGNGSFRLFAVAWFGSGFTSTRQSADAWGLPDVFCVKVDSDTETLLSFPCFWALYTGTGPRASVIRAGVGWRRRAGLVPRCLAAPSKLQHRCDPGQTRRTRNRLHHHFHHHPKPFFGSSCARSSGVQLEYFYRRTRESAEVTIAPVLCVSSVQWQWCLRLELGGTLLLNQFFCAAGSFVGSLLGVGETRCA